MAWVGFVMQGLSTAMSIHGQQEEEDAIRANNLRQANELERRAEQKIGQGQLAREEQLRQKDLIVSRAIALAAFQGGNVTDPNVVNIISDLEGEGVYRGAVEMYNAEQEAEDLRTQAKMLRESNTQIAEAGRTRRITTALQGISSMYGAYNRAYPTSPGGSTTPLAFGSPGDNTAIMNARQTFYRGDIWGNPVQGYR